MPTAEFMNVTTESGPDRVGLAMDDHKDSGRVDAGQMHPPSHDQSGRRSSAASADPTDGAMRVLSYLLAGIAFYGGLGWLIDRLGHQSWGVPVGLIVGMGMSIYLIIKRFGGQQ